ncbi:MAG: sensor histidine kinase [Bacillaceae bacterium]
MKSLYLRIVVVVIVIIFISGLVGFVLSNWRYQASVKQVNEEKIMAITKNVVSFYEENDSLDLHSYLESVAGLQYQVSLFDSEQHMQHFGTAFKEDKIDPAIVDSILKGNIYNGIADYDSNLFVTGFFKDDIQNSIGVPITSNGTTYALFLRPNVQQQFGELHFLFAFMVGSTFLLSILAILFFSRRIVNPIKQLAQATRQIGKGNFQASLNSNRQDEIGSLFRDFNSMSQSLQQLDTMRQEFVSNVSHEIKAPLTSIKGFAQILRNDDLSSEERERYLRIIIEESTRVSFLSEQLLTLASLDSEAKKVNIQPYSLKKQLQDIILSLEPRWVEKDMTIEMDVLPIQLKGDAILLHQVWTNLIENSIKFCPAQSTLTIYTKMTDQLEVVIKDNGPGIEKEHLDRLFERFYKADQTRNRQVKGSGLGLAIVEKIVTIHGGHIEVQSEVGKGTTFKVIFPVRMVESIHEQ